MALIKSISGIRGTIGGKPNENLTPLDIVKFFGSIWHLDQGNGIPFKKNSYWKRWPHQRRNGPQPGGEYPDRSGSGCSGPWIVHNTNGGNGGYAEEKAAGGIIITASHNAKEWNALKLLNSTGEFISSENGLEILEKVAKDAYTFAPVDKLGTYTVDNSYLHKHIQAIVDYPLIDLTAIRGKHFKVVVDTINSTGSLFIPPLLQGTGYRKYQDTE